MRFSQRWKSLLQSGATALLTALIALAFLPGGAAADPPQKAQPTAVIAVNYANVLTNHNDIARTGANLSETILKLSNVKPAYGNGTGFGKLFTMKVDGQMYAQPLYVSQINH